MKATKIEFPNPILASGRDDYNENCSFETTVDYEHIEVTDQNIIIPISYSLVSKTLHNLIETDAAKVVVNVISSSASYSRLFKFPNDIRTIKIEIPKFDVIRRIDITGSIIATNPISGFSGEGEFDELYFGSQTFEIRKGDILATEDTKIIQIDDSELEKPLASIFNIERADEQEENICSNFEDQKIIIALKPELYNLYIDFIKFNNGALRQYVNSVIVYPVLVEAIDKVLQYYSNEPSEDMDDAITDRRWFRSIEIKAGKLNINLEEYQDSSTSVADRLLNGISLNSLKSFRDVLESEINSGETQILGGVD